MNVTIQEHKFSFLSEYDISTPDASFYARKNFFGNSLQLQNKNGRDVAKIQSRFSFFRNEYDFELTDGGIYRFQCEKRLKGVYLCDHNEDHLYLYRHKGVRYSIFKDDRQIAAISRNRVVIGKGHRYEIAVNADANIVVILCMMLALNTPEDDPNDSTVTYDCGNVGPEERPYDESWRPTD
ncbi:MAG TPA: hypothetical protein VIX90_18140 [Edaphobacter sp.]